MRKGFTLVEIMIVIALMGAVTVMSLGYFGKRANNIDNAQKELLTALRSAQAKANTGAGGLNIQVYDLSSFSLPSGVTITSPVPTTGVFICFANPLVTSLTCGTCVAGSYFACNNGTKIPDPPTTTTDTLTITLSDGSRTKQIKIEGSYALINRIYAP